MNSMFRVHNKVCDELYSVLNRVCSYRMAVEFCGVLMCDVFIPTVRVHHIGCVCDALDVLKIDDEETPNIQIKIKHEQF